MEMLHVFWYGTNFSMIIELKECELNLIAKPKEIAMQEN